MRLLRIVLSVLLWAVVAVCLAVTVVPQFLDRIYYRGPASGHFDGAHFFNPDGDDTFAPPGGSRARLIWQQIFGDPTRPVWPVTVPVAQAKPPARVESGAMLATWVGHATLLVQADGVNILTDPVWSERAGPFDIGPERVARPGIAFEDLPRIDIVLVSHNHYDHMDLATLKRLWDRDRPLIVTSLGNDAILRSAGIESEAHDWGGAARLSVRCRGFGPCPAPAEVVVTRNHHWGSRWFADRNRALWSSFVVRLPGGNFFFAGDTGLGDGNWPAEAAALGPIRLAAIPIGAFRFVERQMESGSHIGPGQAIAVWDGLGRPRAIPIHWGTFRLSREGYDTPPRLLDAMLRCAGSDPARFVRAAIGVPVAIPSLAEQGAAKRPDLTAIERCHKAGAFDALR